MQIYHILSYPFSNPIVLLVCALYRKEDEAWYHKLNMCSILVIDQLCPWKNDLHFLSFSLLIGNMEIITLALENYYKDK